MKYRYIPILRWKRGERTALKQTSQPNIREVIPLIVLTADGYKEKLEKHTQPGIPAADLFAEEIHKHWGNRPFYLDASRLPPNPDGTHPLLDIAKCCREGFAPPHLIPATTLGAGVPYEAAVQQIANTDKRGVALRVGMREFTTAQHWIGSWPHALEQTDLISDFGDSSPTFLQLGPGLDQSFKDLHQQRKWRTVTVAGTSIPENFGGFPPGINTIPRAELLIWEQIVQLHLPYRIDYGDYATVSTTPAPSGIKWGYPINVRYTLPKEFLICRGVPTTGPDGVDMDEQLIGHASLIVSYPDRHRIDCWADVTIDRIAASDEKPGNLEHWVKIGVNRHIEWVRSNLP